MATKIYFRRGTLAQVQGIVPEDGEPVWATDEKRVYVGDGITSGGIFVGGSGVGVDTLNSLFGAITLSGGSGITVSVSGQYIIIEEEAGGLDVDSLNGLVGVVTISGVGLVSITEDGQNIVVSGQDVADVDSLNALQGDVTISGVGGVVVEVVGQIITISGGAASSFLGLTDTPESYAGQAGKVVVVNETGDGLEFTTVSGVAVSGLSDINGLVGSVEISGAGGIAVTEVDQVIVISGGGSSVGVFTDLTDTPANYAGSKHKIVTVNEGETALEFAKIVMLHNELADQDYSGLVTSGIAGETLAFGDHAVLNNQSKWVKTIATAENQTDGHIGVVVASGALDDPITLLLLGYVRDDAWSFGVGSGIYIDTTSGELSDTMPTTSGQFVRAVGYAKATSVLYYNPDNNIIELGAS